MQVWRVPHSSYGRPPRLGKSNRPRSDGAHDLMFTPHTPLLVRAFSTHAVLSAGIFSSFPMGIAPSAQNQAYHPPASIRPPQSPYIHPHA